MNWGRWPWTGSGKKKKKITGVLRSRHDEYYTLDLRARLASVMDDFPEAVIMFKNEDDFYSWARLVITYTATIDIFEELHEEIVEARKESKKRKSY